MWIFPLGIDWHEWEETHTKKRFQLFLSFFSISWAVSQSKSTTHINRWCCWCWCCCKKCRKTKTNDYSETCLCNYTNCHLDRHAHIHAFHTCIRSLVWMAKRVDCVSVWVCAAVFVDKTYREMSVPSVDNTSGFIHSQYGHTHILQFHYLVIAKSIRNLWVKRYWCIASIPYTETHRFVN